MDSIADFLTIIRNAARAGKTECTAKWSNICFSIAEILQKQGYIKKTLESKDEKGFKQIKIVLKYVHGRSAITQIKRVSKPGCRQYTEKDKIPRILEGLGICILSTSKGVLSDKEAKKNNVGGEILCNVW